MINSDEALKSFRIVSSLLPWWVGYASEGHDVNIVLRFIKENLPPEHPDYRPSDDVLESKGSGNGN